MSPNLEQADRWLQNLAGSGWRREDRAFAQLVRTQLHDGGSLEWFPQAVEWLREITRASTWDREREFARELLATLAPADRPPASASLFVTVDEANAELARAAANDHLIAPGNVVSHLPEGCAIAITRLSIDPYGNEVYLISGDRQNPKDEDKVGINKFGLLRIAGAMGVTWEASHRTDDGSHPHYCAWEAVAMYPGFDLQPQRVPGNVEIDTREDRRARGAAAQYIRAAAAQRKREHPEEPNDGGEAELLQLRKFLTRYAEGSAMERAIGNRGVRRAYWRFELRKVFAVARIEFTGRSEDPEARTQFRQMIGERFLSARSRLFGPVPRAASQPHAPPPVGHRRY